jgi:hypothetical protein
LLVDNLTYNYKGDCVLGNENRLMGYTEASTYTATFGDLRTLSAANTINYVYDPIGNLIVDKQEGLGTSAGSPGIFWNPAGKVEKIVKVAGAVTTTINYYYDAMGQRCAKRTLVSPATTATWDFYARDAKGNAMANYSRTGSTTFTITTTEQPLYGSTRLGALYPPVTTTAGPQAVQYTITPALLATAKTIKLQAFTNVALRNIGQKNYEITDHLANVRNVITDARLSTRAGTAGLYTFSAFTTNAKAIYNTFAFGMPKTAINDYREAASFKYRYGFNGQEKDNEIKGTGNHNTALFWEYDTRLGRRWNLDPVVKEYESGYACLGNNSILNTDFNGNDTFTINPSGRIKWISISEMDILISVANNEKLKYNKKGELKNDKVSVVEGVLSKKDDDPLHDGTQGWSLDFKTNTENATEVFDFLERIVPNMEFSNIKFSEDENGKDAQSILTTSFDSGEEKVGSYITHRIASGKIRVANSTGIINYLKHTHNHPRSHSDESLNGQASPADKAFYNQIKELVPKAQFYIREKGETFPAN